MLWANGTDIPLMIITVKNFFFLFFFEFTFHFLFTYFCVHWVFITAQTFLWLWRVGSTRHCGAQASHCGGFSYCGAQALGHGLSSGTWASLLHVMWEPLGSEVEPMFPALAGRLLTLDHQRSPDLLFFKVATKLLGHE